MNIITPELSRNLSKIPSFVCVYWNETLKDWDTRGVKTVYELGDEFVNCETDHLTDFAI